MYEQGLAFTDVYFCKTFYLVHILIKLFWEQGILLLLFGYCCYSTGKVKMDLSEKIFCTLKRAVSF